MSYKFKIVKPEYLAHRPGHRFQDNDQFTLYFDKYSSVAEVMALCDDVNAYLIQHIPENANPRGPKDIISMNAFVSGRFDTDKLNASYNVFTFYDQQLKQFFQRYQNQREVFEQVPMGVFEVVFNNILIDDSINNLDKTSFDQQYGAFIQRQLDCIVQHPAKYIQNPELLMIEASTELSETFKRLSDEEKIREMLKMRVCQLGNALDKSSALSQEIEAIKDDISKGDFDTINVNDLRDRISNVQFYHENMEPQQKGILMMLLDRVIALFKRLFSLLTPSAKNEVKPSQSPATLFTRVDDWEKYLQADGVHFTDSEKKNGPLVSPVL